LQRSNNHCPQWSFPRRLYFPNRQIHSCRLISASVSRRIFASLPRDVCIFRISGRPATCAHAQDVVVDVTRKISCSIAPSWRRACRSLHIRYDRANPSVQISADRQ
jgi:hypothetical protein